MPCGKQNGISFELYDGPADDVYFHSFCPAHESKKAVVKRNNSNPRAAPRRASKGSARKKGKRKSKDWVSQALQRSSAPFHFAVR